MRSLAAVVFLVFGVCSSVNQAVAQDGRNHPTFHAVGRFLGVGWSQGYHTYYDGRYPAIKQRHPAEMYASQQLQMYYQGGYAQGRSYHQSSPTLGVPTLAPQVSPSDGTPSPAKPIKPVPAKPVAPPPEWLRPYLQDKDKEPEAEVKDQVEIVPAKPAEPSPKNEPATSGDALLETTSPSDKPSSSDDDLLLLPQATRPSVPRSWPVR